MCTPAKRVPKAKQPVNHKQHFTHCLPMLRKLLRTKLRSKYQVRCIWQSCEIGKPQASSTAGPQPGRQSYDAVLANAARRSHHGTARVKQLCTTIANSTNETTAVRKHPAPQRSRHLKKEKMPTVKKQFSKFGHKRLAGNYGATRK
eukprot:6490988-Amphidinium_carterae.3